MTEWVLEHIHPLNYRAAADLHLAFELVNHQVNPSKKTLECLECLHKIDTPVTNHVVAVTLLEHKVPKLFKKVKEC